MRPLVKNVKDYWMRRLPGIQIDTDVLSDCVNALTVEERAAISLWDGFTDPDADVVFLLSKALNRHNDVCAGNTFIVRDRGGYVVEITAASCISELDISNETLRTCNRACIYHIEDVNKGILPALSFEAIADLTGAILRAETVELSDDRNASCAVVKPQTGCDGSCSNCSCAAKE